MSQTLLAASVLSGLTIVALGVLATIWLQNYRTFRSPMTLGLLAFAVVLMIENLVALYFFQSMKMLYAADSSVHTVVLVLRLLEFLAVAILAYVTWQ
jgi:hypothetical protein